MFASIAYAMGASGGGAPPQGGPEAFMQSMFPLILIFGVFYFLLIRPQQKRAKEMKEMLENLKKGDKVVFSGGIYGVIEALTDNAATVKIAENTRVKIQRAAISSVRTGDDQ